MKQTIKQAFNGYRQLFNVKQYRTGEIVLKIILLPFVSILFTAVFILTWLGYFVERLCAPIFKLFIRFHLKMMVVRGQSRGWVQRLSGLLTVLVSILFTPLVLLYYVAMLLKTLGKALLRTCILKMDFSARYTLREIMIFDDRMSTDATAFESLFKDVDQSQAFGKMLEDYFERHGKEESAVVIEDDDTLK